MRYADIIIDNRTDSTDRPYTYACEDPDVGVGSKVYVPFAKSKNLREGYVIAMRGEEEIDPKLKSRIRMIDHADQDVTLTEESVRTAVWMRDRYVCRCIDALRCFTPAGRKRVRPPAAPQELDPPTLGEPLFSAEDYGNVRQLTQEQQAAIAEINAAIDADTHSRFLLHGVTGSGKTGSGTGQDSDHYGAGDFPDTSDRGTLFGCVRGYADRGAPFQDDPARPL